MKVERKFLSTGDPMVMLTVSRDEARELGRFWRVDPEGNISVTMPPLYATELHLRLSQVVVSDEETPDATGAPK